MAAESDAPYVRMDGKPARDGARAKRCNWCRLACLVLFACALFAVVHLCTTLRPPVLALRTVRVQSVRLGPLRPPLDATGLHELDVLQLCRHVLGHLALRLEATMDLANPNDVLAPFAIASIDELSITIAGAVAKSEPVAMPSVPPRGNVSVPVRFEIPDLLAGADERALRTSAASIAANAPLRINVHVDARVHVTPMVSAAVGSACTLHVQLCPSTLCSGESRPSAAAAAATAPKGALSGDANAACLLEQAPCLAELARRTRTPASSEAHCSPANVSAALRVG